MMTATFLLILILGSAALGFVAGIAYKLICLFFKCLFGVGKTA